MARTTRVPRSQNARLILIGRILFYSAIGFLLVLNSQPWMDVSRQLSREITVIPFLDTLINIPFGIGGWIEWILINFSELIGSLLCVLVQFMELAPMFVSDPVAKAALEALRWPVYVFEFSVCFTKFPAYEGGFAALANDAPYWDTSLIDWRHLLIFIPLAMFGFEWSVRIMKIFLDGLRAG